MLWIDLHSIVETEDAVVDVILTGPRWDKVKKIRIVQGVLATDGNVTRDENHNGLAIDGRLDVNGFGSVLHWSQGLDLLHDIRGSHDLGAFKGHHGLFVLRNKQESSRVVG